MRKIAEDPRKFVKSERITSYSFLFLKHTYTEEQVYQMLTSVVNGEKGIAELNKEYKVCVLVINNIASVAYNQVLSMFKFLKLIIVL